MLHIEPFRAEHLWRFVPVQSFEDRMVLWRAAVEYERSGPGITGSVDGQVLACGGIQIMYPGVGNAWAFPSALVLQYPKLFHETVVHYLEHFIEFFKLRRVQTVVDVDLSRNVRWIERLGFVREGLLRKAGPDGQDQLLFARVRVS